MRKVAYNACYGGFSLSKEACIKLNELNNFKKDDDGYIDPEYGFINEDIIPRHDKNLIKVIEDFYKEDKNPSGCYSDIQIEEINDKYYIGMFDYAEARSTNVFKETLFFGIQYYIKRYLLNPITMEDVEEAKELLENTGVSFNYEDWGYIVDKHNGYLPIRIKAVKEGTLVPNKNVLFTVESTDTKVPWVASFVETLLLKLWYSCNTATRSFYVKKMLKPYFDKTSGNKDIDFTFLNFGDRGSSSVETAIIGGMAHLTSFKGTDNLNSLRYTKRFYGCNMGGYSIDATEHSTLSSWGETDEYKMIDNLLEVNKDKPLVACVMDTYNYLRAVNVVTAGTFLEKIESDEYPNFVIRPDSGNPLELIPKTLDIMEENGVKYYTNKKGYKVFKHYKILWGDGINEDNIKDILDVVTDMGYSVDNFVFGSGGWLMTEHSRDTAGWAMKCSNISLIQDNNIIERDVFKNPITDKKKKSKKGKVTLYKDLDTMDFFTEKIGYTNPKRNFVETLDIVYENGRLYNETSLDEIRENLMSYL